MAMRIRRIAMNDGFVFNSGSFFELNGFRETLRVNFILDSYCLANNCSMEITSQF